MGCYQSTVNDPLGNPTMVSIECHTGQPKLVNQLTFEEQFRDNQIEWLTDDESDSDGVEWI